MANALEDFFKPIYVKIKKTELNGKLASNVAKILGFILGLLNIFLAILIDKIGGKIFDLNMAIIGVLGTPICAVFILGLTCSSIRIFHSLIALLVGSSITSWISIGAIIFKEKALPDISFTTSGCSLMNETDIRKMNETSLFSNIEKKLLFSSKMYYY